MRAKRRECEPGLVRIFGRLPTFGIRMQVSRNIGEAFTDFSGILDDSQIQHFEHARIEGRKMYFPLLSESGVICQN